MPTTILLETKKMISLLQLLVGAAISPYYSPRLLASLGTVGVSLELGYNIEFNVPKYNSVHG